MADTPKPKRKAKRPVAGLTGAPVWLGVPRSVPVHQPACYQCEGDGTLEAGVHCWHCGGSGRNPAVQGDCCQISDGPKRTYDSKPGLGGTIIAGEWFDRMMAVVVITAELRLVQADMRETSSFQAQEWADRMEAACKALENMT